jgi:hypothetical protein
MAARETGGDPRFAIGVSVFIAVALVFPWYSYWVINYLMTREVAAFAQQMQVETDMASAESSAQVARSQAAAAASAQNSAARLQRRRISAVRVMGVSTGGMSPMVLVNLGTSSAMEADEEICRQAERWLHRDLSGIVIRVQRSRGNAPSIDGGELVCP